MSWTDLLMRALEEDHAALTASSEEARIAHAGLADLLRRTADEMRQDGLSRRFKG